MTDSSDNTAAAETDHHSSRHRGAHPEDQRLFAIAQRDVLRAAVADLSLLLTKGYAPTASLKLVGDHFSLRERQRLAVARAACSDQQRAQRQQNRLSLSDLANAHVLIDGFNLIVTLEAALSGGVVFACRDGCWRDLASVHGSYRAVHETETAMRLLGETLAAAHTASVTWLLDQPVSNSGRLAQRLREMATAQRWPWQVEVVMNPDKVLCETAGVAVTSDSNILDHCQRWLNLGRLVIERNLPQVWRVDLSEADPVG